MFIVYYDNEDSLSLELSADDIEEEEEEDDDEEDVVKDDEEEGEDMVDNEEEEEGEDEDDKEEGEEEEDEDEEDWKRLNTNGGNIDEASWFSSLLELLFDFSTNWLKQASHVHTCPHARHTLQVALRQMQHSLSSLTLIPVTPFIADASNVNERHKGHLTFLLFLLTECRPKNLR
jgi:hypothetical protein